MKLLAILPFIFFVSTFSCHAFADDFSILRSRLYDYYINKVSSGTTYLSTMREDGSWDDIDYADTSRTAWKPLAHLSRIKHFCAAYNDTESAYHNSSELLDKIEKGLRFWCANTPSSINWWYNEIGPQLELEPILTLMASDIDSAVLYDVATYLDNRASNSFQTATGENLVWFSSQLIHKGMLLHDDEVMNAGMSHLLSTLEVTSCTGEGGICPDYSFYQHYFLNNGGYGRGFILDLSFWAYQARGLRFSFPVEKVEILSNLILEGMQWMTFLEDFDYASVGREISRKNKLNGTSSIVTTLEYIMNVDAEKNDQYVAYMNHLAGGENSKIGDKYFWSSDYYSHRRKKFAVSVNMSSTRTIGTESANGENTEGYFLASGTMFIESNPGSYFNIPPVWDWSKLPGVTCAQRDSPPRIKYPFLGATDFVGGVTDSVYGTAAMDYEMDNTFGKKSWFFFDEEIVALGAGIKSTNSENIATTLNQHLVHGESYYSDAERKIVTDGEFVIEKAQWLYHDNIAYVFPDRDTLNVSKKSQSGSWSYINQVYPYAAVSEDVFTVWIDHGVTPQSSSYYYIVVPAIEVDQVDVYARDLPVAVLANTSSIQAVKNNTLAITGLVFYDAGSLDLHWANLSSISVDKPCILLLDENNNCLSAANPLQNETKLTVTFALNDGTTENLVYNFPGGDYGGQSIKQALPFPMSSTPTFPWPLIMSGISAAVGSKN